MKNEDFDPVRDIVEFHTKFQLQYEGPARLLDDNLSGFRQEFLHEELMEYGDGVDDQNLAKQFDALIDLVYVALGTAYLQGFDFREGWRRVHAANMQKVRAQKKEDSTRNSTHDVVKPEGWVAPDLNDLVSPTGA